MNINLKQLEVSLNMQDTMNKTVNPEWVTMGWDYMRATMLEAAEAVEHHGWKWWKAQKKDLPQLQMEVVDIWHFYLSHYLQINQGSLEATSAHIVKDWETQQEQPVIFDGASYEPSQLNLLSKFDLLLGLAAAKRTNLHIFFAICEEVELHWSELFKQYIKKNMLNIFRQKNGYKEGTYEKNWFNKEDNVFLVSEAEKLDPTKDTYADELWSALETMYVQALQFRKENPL